jgi:cell division protein YceG involved in septum cleavage
MQPASSPYLYFVAAGADAQGHSLFSSSLEEQNRNVAGYRKAVKKSVAR